MNSTYCKPGDVRYTAAWNPEDDVVTVIIDRYAGICGPANIIPADSREAAAAALFAAGFLTGDDWDVSSSGSHWVSLTPMH